MFIKRSFQIAFTVFIALFLVDQAVNQPLENLLLLVLLVLTCLIAYTALKKWSFFHRPAFLKGLTAVCLAVNLLILAYVATHFQINDVSDPLNVQIRATELLQGNYNWHSNFDGSQEYFYVYPNLVFFTLLITKVMAGAMALGLSIQLTLHFLNFILLALVSLFSILTSWRLTQRIQAVAITAVVLAVYPVMYLYPNLVIYTDTWAMMLTSLIFYLWAIILTSKKQATMVGTLLLTVGANGLLYAIKPNMIILLPAVTILFFWALMVKMTVKWRILAFGLALVLGLLTTTLVTRPLYQSVGYQASAAKKLALPATHWINMGLNPLGSSGKGAYDHRDENLDRQRTIDDRRDLITGSIKHRLALLGPGGLLKLSLEKSETLLGTPLFGYGRYASGYAKAPSFYLAHQSLFDTFFSILATTIVLLVGGQLLLLTWLGLGESSASTATRPFFYLTGLAALGLTAFHSVIWEVEPRYFLPMLYPVLLLIGCGLRLPVGYLNEYLPKRPRLTWRSAVSWSVVTFIILMMTLSAVRTLPSQALGNMQYPIRLSIIRTVPVPKELTFRLPVPQKINMLRIRLRPEPGLRVSLQSGEVLTASRDSYVLEKNFSAGSVLVVHLQQTDNQPSRLRLYRQPDLYKPLFHGSSVTIAGHQYYLPYEMIIYDRHPLDLDAFEES